MKRVIIICEGETEREFCSTILAPVLGKNNVFLQAPLIKKSMGGIIKWPELKKQVLLHLKNDTSAFTTTLIDYYGLYQKHSFPGWDDAHKIPDKVLRMQHLEQAMTMDIDDRWRNRFIPYIQLHEFEGLLFNDIEIFFQQFPKNEITGKKELEQTFHQYDNPEMINNNPHTAPSKRLIRIVKGYNKLVYGNILAEAIGLNNIRNKCPRFNGWLEKLEE